MLQVLLMKSFVDKFTLPAGSSKLLFMMNIVIKPHIKNIVLFIIESSGYNDTSFGYFRFFGVSCFGVGLAWMHLNPNNVLSVF